MVDRPIIFRAPMVKALLDGRKSQTRRLAALPPKKIGGRLMTGCVSPLQRVQPGDRLWVRETCADQHPLAIQSGRYSQPGRAGIPGPPGVTYRTIYRADGEPLQIWRNESGNHPYYTRSGPADEIASRHPTIASNFDRGGIGIYWTPSIHMPRWASRLTLIVTATKIERLQEISEADARAEGVEPLHEGFFPYGIATFMTVMQGDREVPAHYCPTAKVSFKMLWAHLHGPDSWDANPEVIALTFRVIHANIDSAEARAA